MIDVVGFGESSVDFVHVVPELPRAGLSKIPIAAHYTACGGQVATTLAASAAFGLTASYLGAVGADDNGRRIRDDLRARGVDLSRLLVRDAASRYAVILVHERSGERIVLEGRDARLTVPPAELTSGLVANARVVHVDATDEPAAIVLARQARAAGALVTCDIDTVTPRTVELLSHVSHPVLAEGLPERLAGTADLEAALRVLRRGHPGDIVVTLGARGSAALTGDRFVAVPAVPVEAVDTTGAGDVFRSGLILGVLQGWPIERTLRFANAAGALSCTRRGALDGIPAHAAVLALTSAS
jgi:sulfofructose kinase